MRSDLLLQKLRGRVDPAIEEIPAAELDGTELRMLTGVPVDVATAREFLVVPREQLQVVLDGVLLEPLDQMEIGDAGPPLRTPELGGPREHAQVLVRPVVGTPLDGRLG